MQTAMAGLVEVQADMLTALAEEVDTQAAAIVTLTTERDYYRTAAENAQASTQAGWGRAHALSAELRARDAALAEATAAIERLRGTPPVSSPSPSVRPHTYLRDALDAVLPTFAEQVKAALQAVARLHETPAPDGPTPEMLAGRRHEVIGTDPREMTRGWQV